MFPPKRILFPVDFSDRCTDAARMVETFIGHFQSDATLLHVLEPLTYNDLPMDMGEAVEEQLQMYLVDEFKQFEVDRVLLRGDPAHQITEYAHTGHFDLIMLPTHGYGRFRRFILGSVTAKILHDARCPVWTGVHMEHVPRLEDIAFRHVTCAIDLGEQSCRALRWATQFAFEFGARMTIVHAIPALQDATGLYAGYDTPKEVINRAKERIEGVQNSIGCEADISVVAGEVPHVVRSAVERANSDLLVIGRSVENGVLGRLRTNAYSIIRQSPCPVVSV
jgi:nucleotide-binding universal stress UspA family protein